MVCFKYANEAYHKQSTLCIFLTWYPPPPRPPASGWLPARERHNLRPGRRPLAAERVVHHQPHSEQNGQRGRVQLRGSVGSGARGAAAASQHDVQSFQRHCLLWEPASDLPLGGYRGDKWWNVGKSGFISQQISPSLIPRSFQRRSPCSGATRRSWSVKPRASRLRRSSGSTARTSSPTCPETRSSCPRPASTTAAPATRWIPSTTWSTWFLKVTARTVYFFRRTSSCHNVKYYSFLNI